MLRAGRTQRVEPLEVYVPEPIVASGPGADPEHDALLADQVGIALQVVLEALPPAERVAFVLHDMFAMPFGEIARMIERSPDATRQLASRARRRVRSAAPAPDPDLARQRRAVDAFFAAAHEGDLDALLAVLDPDVVLRNHTPRRDLRASWRRASRPRRYGRPAPLRAVRPPGSGPRNSRR